MQIHPTHTSSRMRAAAQPELALDHSRALWDAMRDHFNTRWRRWHQVKDFDKAMEDPITRELLAKTVQSQPHMRGKTR